MEYNLNKRFNIINIFIYLIGIILISSLFYIQILHGNEYRSKSNVRLIKNVEMVPLRGKILSRDGTVLADSETVYGVDFYNIKAENNKVNQIALKLMRILDEEKEEYEHLFPINIKDFTFVNLDKDEKKNIEKIANWKKDMGVPEIASPKEIFNRLKEKYEINTNSDEDAKRILDFREIVRNSSYKGVYGTKIAKRIKRTTAIKIMENSSELHGINITTDFARNYPKGSNASHTIGYIGKISEKELKKAKDEKKEYDERSIIGKTGIESIFEEKLKGKYGEKQIEVDVDGNVVGEYIIKEPINGSDVVLTLDDKLQAFVENEIAIHFQKLINGSYGKKTNPTGASVVVMDVKKGEVLAMVSYPGFNPSEFIGGISSEKWNEYNNEMYTPLVNRSISGSYAPGSTFKMISAFSALGTGKFGADEDVYCNGIYPRAHKPRCWIANYGQIHGNVNVVDALKHSCNYYFYEVGHRVGIEALSDYALYFGLGRKTGIELEGEVSGLVASTETAEKRGEKWTEGGILSAAIGQSYNSFTPLQMSKYISMVANGGKEISPTIIKALISSSGSHVSKTDIQNLVKKKTGFEKQEIVKKEFDSTIVKAVHNGMHEVTTYGGTAYSTFRNFNIEVAAKTGTAEVGDKTNALFAAFAPFNEPEIAIFSVVENGYEGYYNGEMVRNIIDFYFKNNKKNVFDEKRNTVIEGEFIYN